MSRFMALFIFLINGLVFLQRVYIPFFQIDAAKRPTAVMQKIKVSRCQTPLIKNNRRIQAIGILKHLCLGLIIALSVHSRHDPMIFANPVGGILQMF